MQYQDKDRKKLRGIFPAESKVTGNDLSQDSSAAVMSSAGQLYAIASEDEVIKRFKLILRSGYVYSLSYALLPIYVLMDGQELLIKAYGVHISILGRNLATLENYLSEECLLWAKESASGKDDGTAKVFISDINIEGEALSAFSES